LRGGAAARKAGFQGDGFDNTPDTTPTLPSLPIKGIVTGMNGTQLAKPPPVTAERLALAQKAFQEFHALCFWFMRPDAEIVAEEVPYICERLRADGGRRGFQVAAEICR
jgi:hypothetical protein